MDAVTVVGWVAIVYLAVGLCKLTLSLPAMPTALAVWLYYAQPRGPILWLWMIWSVCAVLIIVLAWPVALYVEGVHFFDTYDKQQVALEVAEVVREYRQRNR